MIGQEKKILFEVTQDSTEYAVFSRYAVAVILLTEVLYVAIKLVSHEICRYECRIGIVFL